jgi:AraC-like DNA-binding protein
MVVSGGETASMETYTDVSASSRGGVPARDWAHISRDSVSESEAYTDAVTGVRVETQRLGNGVGPSEIRTLVEQRFIATSGTTGFPLAHYATIPDDALIVVHICNASPGSTWCGIDLEPGTVIVYSPSADHAGVDQPGLEFTFVATSVDQIGEVADRLHLDVPPLERGMVRPAQIETPAVDRAFRALSRTMRNDDAADPRVGTEALCAMVDLLAGSSQALNGIRGAHKLSVDVTKASLDHAESMGRIPSIGELCLAAHVSERRLRIAFADVFDMSPHQFLRVWALEKAHRRLGTNGSDTVSVSRVAVDLGFEHLGRFSGYYREAYGVLPSATLRSDTSNAMST